MVTKRETPIPLYEMQFRENCCISSPGASSVINSDCHDSVSNEQRGDISHYRYFAGLIQCQVSSPTSLKDLSMALCLEDELSSEFKG